MPIVTGPDGTRYRPCPAEEATYVYVPKGGPALGVLRRAGHRIAPDAWRPLKELPRIPDWPMPSQAPQYLAGPEHPDVRANPGDVLLAISSNDYGEPTVSLVTPRMVSGFLDGVADYGECCGLLQGNDEEPGLYDECDPNAKVYLIARADPGADA